MEIVNDLIGEVIEIAREAGNFIKREASHFNKSDIEHKGKHDLVSYVDKSAEELIIKKLQTILPPAGFIAEEGGGIRNDHSYQWVIDPLDGTTNFIHGIPAYCVSIALMKDQVIILGVIYDPNTEEVFHATKGHGAFRDDQKIHVSRTEKLTDSLLAVGLPISNFEPLGEYIEVIKKIVPKCQGLRRMGSAALDLAHVADGRYEAYFEYNLKIWDIAAGVLLVKEAGGKVSDFQGEANYLQSGQILASNAIHNEILELL